MNDVSHLDTISYYMEIKVMKPLLTNYLISVLVYN
jgi:hypothetical protein